VRPASTAQARTRRSLTSLEAAFITDIGDSGSKADNLRHGTARSAGDEEVWRLEKEQRQRLDNAADRINRKLVIIGDGACGKTSLLSVFTLGYFPTVCAAQSNLATPIGIAMAYG
jgi:hypothetical protein